MLLHHLRHNRVLHQQVLLLTVHVRDMPQVAAVDRFKIEDIGRESPIPTSEVPGMWVWREPLSAFVARNALPERVIEPGIQIEIWIPAAVIINKGSQRKHEALWPVIANGRISSIARMRRIKSVEKSSPS